MEAPWQKKHKEVMALEAEKNRLHADIEKLQTEESRLHASLTDLRKCILVDKGDYKLIEAERIAKIEEIDEKLVDVSLELEEKQGSLRSISATVDSLERTIGPLEKKIKEKEKEKLELEENIGILSESLKTLKASHLKEAEDKRITLRDLIAEINAGREELRKIKKEHEETRIEILRENRLLSIRRSDLEIYEARMRKKYPSETFVLTNNDTAPSNKN